MNQDALKHLDALASEVIRALQYQSIHYHLLDTDDKVDTLNKMCPEIWRIVSDALWDATIAAAGRLCDKDWVSGNSNITVYTVADEFDPSGELREDIVQLLDEYRSTKEAVVKFRHKTVAHPDANTRLGDPGKDKLVSINTSQIDTVLEGVAKAVDVIAKFAELPEYQWGHYTEVRVDSFFEIIRAGQQVVGDIPA
ncbi:MAG: hypothetical protein NXI07_04345 [bacterium]|nr:hypothetical protein [bacterium]